MWSYLCDKCAGNSLRILLWLVGCGELGNVVFALSVDFVSKSLSLQVYQDLNCYVNEDLSLKLEEKV